MNAYVIDRKAGRVVCYGNRFDMAEWMDGNPIALGRMVLVKDYEDFHAKFSPFEVEKILGNMNIDAKNMMDQGIVREAWNSLEFLNLPKWEEGMIKEYLSMELKTI